MALAIALRLELDGGGSIQIAGIAFVRIDVDFQLGCRVSANQQVVKGHTALRAVHLERHQVAILNAVIVAAHRNSCAHAGQRE